MVRGKLFNEGQNQWKKQMNCILDIYVKDENHPYRFTRNLSKTKYSVIRSSIGSIWTYVETITSQEISEHSEDKFAHPQIDLAYQNYVWRFLRLLKDLQFFERIDDDLSDKSSLEASPSQLAKLKSSASERNESEISSSWTQSESKNEKEKESLSHPKNEKNSNTIERIPDVPNSYILIPNIAKLEYNQVLNLFGSRLYAVAKKEIQNKELFKDVPPGPLLSNNTIAALKVIIQSRHNGVSQHTLADLLKFDSRATGQYLRVLEQKGAIFRNVSTLNGANLNLYTHVRFGKPAKRNDGVAKETSAETVDSCCAYNTNRLGIAYSHELLLSKIIDLLNKAPNDSISSNEILSSLDFNLNNTSVQNWLNRAIDTFCLKGHLQKLNFRDTSKSKNNQSVKLPKNQDEKESRPNYISSKNIKCEQRHCIELPVIKAKACTPYSTKLLRDVTLEHQIIMVLRKSGTKGDIAKEIGCENTSPFTRIMDKLVNLDGVGKESYAAYRHLESKGRNRQYRYYTYTAYKKVIDNIDIDDEFHIPSPFTDSDMVEFDYLSIRSKIPATRNSGNQLNSTTSSKKITLSKNTQSQQKHAEVDIHKENSARISHLEPESNAYVPSNLKKATKTPSKRSAEKSSEENNPNETPNPRQKRTRNITQPNETKPALPKRNTRSSILASNTLLRETSVEETFNSEPSDVAVVPTNKALSCNSGNDIGMNNPDLESVLHLKPQEKSRYPKRSTQDTRGSVHPDDSVTEPINILTPKSQESVLLVLKDKTEKKAATKPVTTAILDNKESSFVENTQNGLESGQATSHSSPDVDRQSVDLTNLLENSNKVNVIKGGVGKIPIDNTAAKKMLDKKAPRKTRSRTTLQTKQADKPISVPTRSSKRLFESTSKISDFFSKAPLKKTPAILPKTTTYPLVESAQNPSHDSVTEPIIEHLQKDSSKVVTAPVKSQYKPQQEATNDRIQSINAEEAEKSISTKPSDIKKHTGKPGPETPDEDMINVIPEIRKRLSSTEDSPYSSASEFPESEIANVSGKEEPSNSSEHQKKKRKKSSPHLREPHNRLSKKEMQVNYYLEQRKKVFMALLEECPIYVRNHAFRNLYCDKFTELFGEINPSKTICLKTIWRTAKELHKDGLVETKEISTTLMSGAIMKRGVFYRKGLDLDGPELKSYTSIWNKDHFVYPGTYSIKKFEKIEKPVERLTERLGRMEKDLEKAKNNNSVEVKEIEKKITNMKQNINNSNADEISTHRPSTGSYGNWMIIGMQLGYMCAKNIRCKLLHQFFIEIFERNLPGVDSKTRWISIRAIVEQMTLADYFTLIGFFQTDNEMREFIKNPKNKSVKILNLPKNIRLIIFSDKNRLRRRICTLLEVLEWLNLIKRAPGGADKLDLPPNQIVSDETSYIVLDHVSTFDLMDPERRTIHHYEIRDAGDIHVYWSDLQYICNKIENERPDFSKVNLSEEDKARILSLISAKNWSTTFMFTDAQRTALNAYINPKNGMTPLRNVPLCKKIARKLGLENPIIQGYFRKIEQAFVRKTEKKFLRVIERENGTDIRGKKRSRSKMFSENPNITLRTTQPFKRRVYSTGAIRMAKRAISKGDGDITTDTGSQPMGLYHDTADETPVVGEADFKEYTDRPAFNRIPWSEDEDELLVYCYVILKHRSENDRMRWTLAVPFFPERNRHKMRGRFSKIILIPSYQRKIFNMMKLWKILYEEGVATGRIKELPEGISKQTFGISDELIYFLERSRDISENNLPTNSLNLPCKPIEGVNFPKISKLDEKVFLEDNYHRAVSRKSRQDIICSVTCTAKFSDKNGWDTVLTDHPTETNIKQRQIMFLKGFHKMVLLTPEEYYDTFYVYAIMNQMPRGLSALVATEQRIEGIVARLKSTNFRKLPGTLFGISDRFTRRMSGTFPHNYYQKAREYFNHMLQNKGLEVSPTYLNSGIMGCLLDQFSDGKKQLVFSIKDFEEFSKRPSLNFHSSRSVDSARLDFDIMVKTHQHQEQENIPEHVEYNSTAILLTQDAFESAYNNLKHMNNCLQTLIDDIVAALSLAKHDGLSILEIKNVIPLRQKIQDSDIRKAIHIMTEHSPPLVAYVGYEAYRLVLTTCLDQWVVIPSTAFRNKGDNEENSSKYESLAVKGVVNLRIWNDVNGTRTESVWNGCVGAVTDLIINKPGITEANIERFFKHVLVRTEIQDLLNTLVKQKILRKLVMSTTKQKASLFGKNLIMETTEPDQIQALKRTCYWVISGYYTRIKA
ncbi:Homeodomain-like DNA binding domain-containing transcription factor [Phycomyces blakesleeanus NRRL 1555(-)]|uniref:Homeodomain-like DNA binding domain-containing transcription factor n=1 Tax=Phycomyces blakesleeanus (strain ATCC 8743b / DSM 1359 / FGSC 10004 / NBRC 33097 / NRRL 1555) TaxID=763407 RepID=A0A162N5S7_PHYB8|nr:Homeodomain-like DNA binding domain-containing transcription factor [Phycomyces blakesleeanus NRRL 1555(-)]OAD66064.1 Homeodomain-like DNA binding domain-containing transcription factor [Phycomyces blakesleeanus NRRL 1555(-)]|eukprot:XP_018284104.1 Homeodomain-like DNA binding domain-containing transcription factor [Phycomyces blakesleeanus NRRL 1555(-)]